MFMWSNLSNNGRLAWKLQESNSWSLHAAGCHSWSSVVTRIHPKEVGSDDSEEMDLPAKASKVRQREQASFLPALHRGCQKEVWPRLSVDLPT